MQGHPQDEDMDSILSSIMNGANTARPEQVQQRQPKPAPVAPAHTRQPLEQRAMPRHAPTTKQSRTNKPKSKKKVVAFGLVSIVLVFGLMAVARPAVSIIFPSSPFSKDLALGAGYPLLYPGKLPSGYKIDKSSINKSTNGVIVYALKNSEGKVINVSLQQQPQSLNLKPLYDTMQNIRTVETPAGETTVGITQDNMLTSNTLSGSVWVIIRAQPDTVKDQEIDAMLKSLKQG